MTVEESRDLLALASNNGRVLGVVHNFQFARSVVRALHILERGSLGPLREVWGLQLSNPRRRLPDWYEELPLGLFYDESPHFFYLMRRFLGGGIAVGDTTVVHRHGRHTPVSVGAQLTGGAVPGRIDMHFEAPVSEWHLMVVGSRRLAIIDIFRDILVTLPNDGEHSAREILRTSAEAGVRHVVGAVTSGVLHASGRLAYGNDEVMRRFVTSCRNQSRSRTDERRGRSGGGRTAARCPQSGITLMRILASSNYFPEHIGGIERVAGDLVGALRAHGHTVQWVAAEPTDYPHRGDAEDAPIPAWNVTERRLGISLPVTGSSIWTSTPRVRRGERRRASP